MPHRDGDPSRKPGAHRRMRSPRCAIRQAAPAFAGGAAEAEHQHAVADNVSCANVTQIDTNTGSHVVAGVLILLTI
jgi:hypothetical protein